MHFKCSDISFTSEEQIPWVLDGEFGGNQTKVNIRVENKRSDICLQNIRKCGSFMQKMKKKRV